MRFRDAVERVLTVRWQTPGQRGRISDGQAPRKPRDSKRLAATTKKAVGSSWAAYYFFRLRASSRYAGWNGEVITRLIANARTAPINKANQGLGKGSVLRQCH
jgi:hypothetical protein